MRDILFRAKRADNADWVQGDLAQNQIDNNPVTWIENYNSKTWIRQSIQVIPETIGQFTGLTDKNGIKIFEGDVLKCINPNDRKEYITEFIASLVNGFTFKNIKLVRELALYDNDWPDEIEVIGNIHDNPKLI